MVKVKRVKHTPAPAPAPALPHLSSELGDGDFAFKFDKKNGRAIRKCRTQPLDSPFEDSAIAISDPDSDDYEEIEVGDTIAVASRKRKRSASPPNALLPSDDYHAGTASSSSGADQADVDDSPAPVSRTAGHTTLHLTVNIPPGQQGPITLQLDPANLASLPSIGSSGPDPLTQSTLARINARSKSNRKKKYAGFLDLPAELRNNCYRAIFVSEKKVSFSKPDNFSRSAQLLRTCRQVYEEGRSILYSENTFAIERRIQRHGSFWEDDWRELGYLPVRKFIKSIGPGNIGLIRSITMFLEDATPCLNPSKMTTEERRFVNDDDLISVLRHLGNHAQLQSLSMHFHGRRRVDRTDDRFLSYMKRIKADAVSFTSWPPATQYARDSKQDLAVRHMLLTTCTRKKKKFD